MVSTVLAGPAPARPASSRSLIRWLYCNNPFYVISAGLVFLGLRASFAPGGKPGETGLLMLGLAGYALLLAVTAWALIRLGQVWDDLRTVLLLVVLMFLAISVTFDYTLVAHSRLGQAYYLGGLAFAIVVSEALLRGIGLRLPALFRVPYHLILLLFFLYPLVLGHLSDRPDSPALQWTLFGFAPLAGLVFLTLLPAIRRGPDYVDRNGSPWTWPLYPWVLFGLLAFGVLVRSYWLCVSFHFVLQSRSIFGPYVLVPFLLCLAVLLVEISLAAGRSGVVRLALTAPLGLVALALSGHRVDPVYTGFLRQFTETLGATPAYLTLVALVGFYGWWTCRRVALAAEGLALSLAGFVGIGLATFSTTDLTAPQAWPLAASAVVLVVRAGALRDPVRGLIGTLMMGIAAWIALPDRLSELQRLALIDHAVMVAALVLGTVVPDRVMRALEQGLGLLLLGITGLVVLLHAAQGLGDIPRPVAWGYPPLAAILALIYGALLANLFGRRVALALGGVWLLAVGRDGYFYLRALVAGLDRIALGMVFFGLALLISLRKAGVLPPRRDPRATASESAPATKVEIPQ